MCLEYKIEKQDLIPCQVNQINLLRTHLQDIKKQKFEIFPEDLEIEENDQQFIFYYKETGEQEQTNAEIVSQVLKTYFIEQIVKLTNYLSKLKIFLPLIETCSFFNCGLQIKTEAYYENEENKFINSTYKIILYKFGLENLQNPEQFQDRISIAQELKIQIENGEANQIEYDEKMTVFALGRLIASVLSGILLNNMEIVRRDIISNQFSYEIFQYEKIIQQCMDNDPEKRPTLQEINAQIQKLKQLSQYTRRVRELQNPGLTKKQLMEENLNQLVINCLKLKNYQLQSGRMYVQQHLCKIKFIFQLLTQQIIQNFDNIQLSMEYMVLQQIYHQFEEIEKLKEFQYPNVFIPNNQIPYDFDDSIDEINEFRDEFLDQYLNTMLLPLIQEIFRNRQNMQINVSYILFYEEQNKQSQNELHQIIYNNLDKVFKHLHLYQNFPRLISPVQNYEISSYDIYDKLLQFIFIEKEFQDGQMIKKLKKSLNL